LQESIDQETDSAPDYSGFQCQCRRTMAVCQECPAPPQSRLRYGCDPILKVCACAVPHYTETRCTTNAECVSADAASGPACQLLSTELTLSPSSVPCATCAGLTTCVVAPGAAAGVCACALHDTRLARCPASEHTQAVWPGFEELCFFDASEAAARSTRYRADAANLAAARCMDLNPSTTFCFDVAYAQGVSVFHVVGHDLVRRRRRLLGADGNSTPDLDATPFAGALLPILVSPYMPAPVRRLLGLHDALASAQLRFEEMAATHYSFAADVASAFSSAYTPLTDRQASAWLGAWPPETVSADSSQCSVLPKIVQRFGWALHNATTYYDMLGKGQLRTQPAATSLRHSWPVLRDSSAVPAFARQPEPDEQDPAVTAAVAALDFLLGLVGATPDSVYDLIYTVVTEARDAFTCDLEAVQLCSQWRVSFVNGFIVVSVLTSAWFLVAQALGLSFLAYIVTPFFALFQLGLCYGYDWACLPLVPTCLLTDVHASLNNTFPAQILPLPASLLRAGTPGCDAAAIAVGGAPLTAACVHDCRDAPWRYTSWEAPLAWALAELGAGPAFVEHVLPWLPVAQTSIVYHVNQKDKALRDGTALFLNRACAVITSYRLLPYLLLAAVALTAAVVAARFVVTLAYALAVLVGAVAVNVFSE
jgi:hypothetical protein